MRSGGGVQSGACEGAVCGGAASGRAGFDAVYDMVQPFGSVRVEVCKDACCVESCFGAEFARKVNAKGEERSETGDGG
jgi:hypothetical protein